MPRTSLTRAGVAAVPLGTLLAIALPCVPALADGCVVSDTGRVTCQAESGGRPPSSSGGTAAKPPASSGGQKNSGQQRQRPSSAGNMNAANRQGDAPQEPLPEAAFPNAPGGAQSVALPLPGGNQAPPAAQPAADPVPVGPPPPPPIDPGVAAARAVDQLQLTAPAPNFGPDPSLNEWNMAVVGIPYWLWGTGGTTNPIGQSVTVEGLTVAMQTDSPRVVWSMGDGTTRTCGLGTPWTPQVRPGAESPTCGHRYQRRGDYQITATATWQVNWTAGGAAGVTEVTQTATGPAFHVGELQSVVVN